MPDEPEPTTQGEITDMALIADSIRERRQQLGVTQSEAARSAGVSDTTWGNAENGRPVSDLSMAKILRGLGWESGSPSKVLRGEDDSLELVVRRIGGERPPAEVELLAAVRDLTEVVRDLQAQLAEARQPPVQTGLRLAAREGSPDPHADEIGPASTRHPGGADPTPGPGE